MGAPEFSAFALRAPADRPVLERIASTLFQPAPLTAAPEVVAPPNPRTTDEPSNQRTPEPAPENPSTRAPKNLRSGSYRPVFVPLYVTFAALQVMDVHSTLSAIGNGAGREANPLMAGVVNTPAAFVAVKAAMTTGVIYGAERLRKRSALAAIVVMSAMDSLYAVVAAHNYAVASR